ncbi:MAG: M48 family metalloprotease [Desulfatirhabdiaceae bacterium]
MFEQFLYFIIVLLIYTTYHTPESPAFSGPETFGLFVLLHLLFAVATRIVFRRLEKRIHQTPRMILDNQYHSRLTRHSILAIMLFAVDIYILNLSVFTGRVPLLARFPTLEALLFILIFLGYMTLIWTVAHPVYRILYQTDSSLGEYIRSQTYFSVPVYLPWLVLSGISDLILALPFEQPGKWMKTPEGEIIYFAIFLFAAAIVGPAMIQKFWQCTPLEPGYMRDRIERLFRRAGFSCAEIMYWPIFGGQMITAGVMGLVRRFRYLLVTRSLLQVLSPDEIEAVVAHEIGHIKKKHLLFYLFFFAGYMVISFAMFDLILYAVIYARPLIDLLPFRKIDHSALTSAISTGCTILLFLVYFRYGFGYFMRNFERQADAYVFTLFETSVPLIRTLEKIGFTSVQPLDKPNWHHFSIAERIDFLWRCERDRSWILRHDRILRKSLIGYTCVILGMGFLGYALNFGETGRDLNRHFFEKIVLGEIERNPENSELQTFLGDLYYTRKDWFRSRLAYHKAIEINPDNHTALNNLAWLLSTCEDHRFRDVTTAIQLAEKAVSLHDSAQLLDTLAESYAAAGRWEEALAAAKRALQMATQDLPYFEKQVERFSKRLKAEG